MGLVQVCVLKLAALDVRDVKAARPGHHRVAMAAAVVVERVVLGVRVVL